MFQWMVDPSFQTRQEFGANPGPPYNPPGGHTGKDKGTPVGTPVYAGGDGTVVAAGQMGSWETNDLWINGPWAGNVVYIDHGPVILGAAHLDRVLVSKGQKVVAGQLVAYTGQTGLASTGPHCHLEAMADGYDLNSSTYGRVNPDEWCSGFVSAPAQAEVQASNETEITDMTPDEFKEAVKAAMVDLAQHNTDFRTAIAEAIMYYPIPLVDPTGETGNTDPTTKTTLATKVGWAAHNDAQILERITVNR